LQDDRNKISVCGYAGIKTSGDTGVQGWNGKMGRWIVVKRFTGLLNEFSTLGLDLTTDFGLPIISTGCSCRKHRVSCRMPNFKTNEAKNLGKDSNDGVMDCEGCMQLVMSFPLVQSSCNDLPATYNLFKRS